MKKIILIIVIIAILIVTTSIIVVRNNPKKQNNDVIEINNTNTFLDNKNVDNTNLSVKYNSIEDYNNIINARGNNYDESLAPQNIFLNTRLIKEDEKVVLISDIGNPYSFSYEEIKKIVDDLEGSDEREAHLGIYTIHKDYIEGFYRWYIGDFGLEYEFVDDSFDKAKWFNEDRIPYYITDSNGSFVKLKYKDGYYIPYWCGVPIGEIALVDNINKDAFKLIVNNDDKIVLYEANGFYEDSYTANDIFNNKVNPIYGVSKYNSDCFEIKDGIIRICTANGDGL